MRRLMISTILVSTLGAGMGLAQPTGSAEPSTGRAANWTQPSGYSLWDQSSDIDDLRGAELFDVMDVRIGTVVELIQAGTGEAAGAAEKVDDKTVGDGAPMDAEATGSSGVGAMAGAGTGDTGGTVATPGVEGAAPQPAEDAVEASPAVESGAPGAFSHAILEVDNAPSDAGHRVAVPLAEIQIYRNDTAFRAYISRTRDELLALRVYDANDPSTLDAFNAK